jgi:DNA-binding NtrC family response regulator
MQIESIHSKNSYQLMTPTTIRSSNTSNKFQSVIVHERDKGLRKALAITLIDYFYETRLTQMFHNCSTCLNQTKPSVMLLDYTDEELTRETIALLAKLLASAEIVLTYVELSEIEKEVNENWCELSDREAI